jgi:hypothetical protein
VASESPVALPALLMPTPQAGSLETTPQQGSSSSEWSALGTAAICVVSVLIVSALIVLAYRKKALTGRNRMSDQDSLSLAHESSAEVVAV